jgi:hypothetical protein
MHSGDDAIENDWKDAITVYQNYLSGVSILSIRPAGGSTPENTNTSSKVITLDGNLMRLTPKAFPDLRPGSSGSYGTPLVFFFFKQQVVNSSFAMKVVLKNNVLLYNGDPVNGGGSPWGSLQASQISSSSNNVALFPTLSSGLPPGWPAGLSGFTYIYGSAARTRWNQEINNWMAAHPDVVVQDPGLF